MASQLLLQGPREYPRVGKTREDPSGSLRGRVNRFGIIAVLSAGFGLVVAGCGSNTDVSTIQITPTSQSLAAGQTAQFTATGIITHGKHPSSSTDVTSMVTWASNAPSIATISTSGLATAVSAGTATLTATMAGAVSATATITVTGGSVSPNNDIVSLTLIPGSQSVNQPNQSSQFIAIGANAAGSTVNLTGQVAWSSSSTSVATINAAGLATGVGKGSATISAIYTNPDKTIASATATFTVVNGAAEPITALSITPTAQSLSASGQTGQFIAIGTSGTGVTEDLTNAPQLKWVSSIPSVASVTTGLASGSGVVTGVSVGTTTISAVWTNPDSTIVSATATVTVALTAPPNPLLSLQIIPDKISVGNLQGTGQFLAIGTFSTPPYVRDVTNSPNTTWISSFPDVFPVNTNSGGTSSATAGIVTAYGNGSANIIAEYTDPITQTIQTASGQFTCPLQLPDPNTHPPTPGSCFPGSEATPLKVTVTIYGEGLNTTNWLVTAPSATGTPDVIHCGPGWAADDNPGGSVCVGIYPVDTPSITLTAPRRPGVAFGGWTYNCHPTAAITEDGPNSCTIYLNENPSVTPTNVSVGAIFNNK
jgi:uncharacterized protein YjdB